MSSRDTTSSRISVQVFDEFDSLVSDAWLRRIAEGVLDLELNCSPDELSIVIAGDETVRELNREHRGLDENTDVLSFAFNHQGEYYGEGKSPSEWSQDVNFVMPPGAGAGLGEVIVSYPQAVRQAEEAGHPVTRELAYLLCHGILHLLGHDHMEPDEAAAMKAKETAILARSLRARTAASRSPKLR